MAKSTIVISLLICSISQITQTNGQCSDADRTANLPGCLSAITGLLENNDEYYFGTSYPDRCPAEIVSTLDCLTFLGVPPNNIIARMQSSTGEVMQTTNINRWLGVQYTSPPGEYTGCDNPYVDEETNTFSLDPVSDEPITPWMTRNQPVFTWDTSLDNNGQLYTLLLQDVGYGYTHTLWMNIPGNDLSSATVIRPFLSPGNPRETPNVYIYFLFKQNARVTLNSKWQDAWANPNPTYTSVHWLEFMAENGLSGPIAANWHLITGDTFSAQRSIDLAFANNCAFFVNKELQKQKATRPFLPPTFSLSVFMRVHFVSIQLNVIVCCNTYTYKAEDVYTDPIGSGYILPATARTDDSTHTVTLHKNKQFPNDTIDFAGEYHTLVMIDPDAADVDFGSNDRPYLHWLVINAPNGAISEGTVLSSYMGPAPLDVKDHTYYFLLYKQATSNIAATANIADFITGCERCSFDLKQFVTDNDLELVGASWMKIKTDGFVRYTWTQFGQNETIVCEGVTGYADPCPASASAFKALNYFIILLSSLIIYDVMIHN